MDEVVMTPTGFYAFLTIIPIIVILVLLFLKVNMLVSGLIGGILAMVIGGIGLERANELLLESIPDILTVTVPIINSAIAGAVSKSGGYLAALTLVKRKIGNKIEYLAAFIVFLTSAATYMSGIGGGTAMVLAPLAFAAVGVIPEVIVGMSIAAAVSFTTSPASLETSVATNLAGVAATDYVSAMRPYWILFTVIAIVIAFIGTKRRGALLEDEDEGELEDKTDQELFKNTIPVIFLLFAVIVGPIINNLVGMPILGPLMYMIITVGLIALCTDLNISESADAMIDGSTYILTKLFQVGIFLTFINIIGDTGAFSAIVSVINVVPEAFVVPVAVIAGFAIGVPAGAYVGSILTLVLPVAISLNLPILSIGFITMGIGLGSQLSFVNITTQAISSGFETPILDVVRGNTKWIILSLLLLTVLSGIM